MSAYLFGCVGMHEPNWVTGEDCWRFSVAESDNTGPMSRTPLDEIPVVRLNYADLAKACDVLLPPATWRNQNYMMVRACYQPKTDMIYMHYFSGNMELYEERCHVLLGRKHNKCRGYGIGQDESACEWQTISDHNAVMQERIDRSMRN